MRRRRRGLATGLIGAAMGLLALGPWACGGKIVRLTDKGAYDEAISEAQARAVAPRGKAARAYALALVERDRQPQARSVLLADYRHGGDLRSLVALADLEYSLGLHGIAASHYGRVVELSVSALEGRDEVCALLRRRAALWAAEGAGLAADRDLGRARQACGEPEEVALAAELEALRITVEAAAQAEVDARVERSRHETFARARGESINEARKQGAAELRRVAARKRVELPPTDIVAILSADLRAEAGDALVTDDELRGLVGEQGWSALAPVVMSQTAEVAAYLQLRLAAVLPEVPVTLRSRTGPGELDLWLAKSLELTDDHAWRVLAWAGDLTGAELALGGAWRPPRRPVAVLGADEVGSGNEAEPGPSPSDASATELVVVHGVVAPRHWTSRVVPTPQNFGALLLEGRLRHVAGQEARGVEIQRYVAARALAAALPRVDALVAREAAWHLAHGRPWQALAVARVVSQPQSQRVLAAAATALRLVEAFCDGECKDDHDRDQVERALGESWVEEQRAQLVALSRGRTRPAEALDACPTLGELLTPDARGRLAEALVSVHDDPGAPGRGRQLGEAIEADLGLSCAGRYVLPLLREGGHRATADALAESLAHDATLDAPRALAMHSALAMVGGRARQASLLATAAGAVSTDPARTWRELAQQAHATGQRELTLRSLREALMHTPGLDDPLLTRALVLASLSGIDEGWNLRETEAGQLEPVAHVRDLVERVEPAGRWAVREDLARALADQPWLDADARVRLAPALWPEPAIERAHPIAGAWLLLASGGSVDLEVADVGPLDLAALELLVTLHKLGAMPPATAVFVEPSHMEPLRQAIVAHSRIWPLRWRTAIGLATYGTPTHRARAMTQLLELAEPGPRDALIELLLEQPAVVQPGPYREGLHEAPLVATSEQELAVVFGLPLDPLGL